MRETPPSPPWGRGWPAAGVFTSRGGTGEGVKPVETPLRYRQTRSVARTAGDIFPDGNVLQAPNLLVQEVVRFVLLREAVG